MLKHIQIATLTVGCLALTTPFASLRAQVTTEAPVEAGQKTTAAPTLTLGDQSSPDATLRSIASSMTSAQPAAVWGAIAPADRKRIEGILHGVAAKVDPGLYDEVSGLLKQLGAVVKQNLKFIANNEQLAAGEEPAAVEARWSGVVRSLETLTSSSLGSHKSLATFSIDQFMANQGADMLSHAMALANDPMSGLDLPDFTKVEFGEPKIDGDKATVEVTTEEGSQAVELKQVDGKWYFDMDEPLAEAESGIADLPKMEPQDAMQIRGPIKMFVAPALAQFAKVESQEDFDEQLETMMQTFMGMMMGGMGGGMGR